MKLIKIADTIINMDLVTEIYINRPIGPEDTAPKDGVTVFFACRDGDGQASKFFIGEEAKVLQAYVITNAEDLIRKMGGLWKPIDLEKMAIEVKEAIPRTPMRDSTVRGIDVGITNASDYNPELPFDLAVPTGIRYGRSMRRGDRVSIVLANRIIREGMVTEVNGEGMPVKVHFDPAQEE